jgi:hypothetical protein
MNATQLQKNIMRRVYYTYALSIAVHSMLWRGVFLGAAAVLLAQWLHVASIFNNLLSVPVGAVPKYIASALLNAATHGEVLMLLTFTAASLVGLSCLYRILQSVHLGEFFTHSPS